MYSYFVCFLCDAEWYIPHVSVHADWLLFIIDVIDTDSDSCSGWKFVIVNCLQSKYNTSFAACIPVLFSFMVVS